MAVFEFQTLPRYMVWADGLLPNASELDKRANTHLREAYRKGHRPIDDYFLGELHQSMYEKYKINGRTKDPDFIQADIYTIRPPENPTFPHRFNPVNEELEVLGDERERYRLMAVVHHTETPGEWKDIFLSSLDELGFEVRPEDMYHDLERLKKYLRELSDEKIAAQYYAPNGVAADALESMGFAVDTDTVF